MVENELYRTSASEKMNRIIEFDPRVPVISVRGGGMLLPWYSGAVKAILEARGEDPVIFAAFSSGAIASAILLCGLSIKDAGKVLARLMDEHGVSERTLGMALVWGEITTKWLDEVFPENAAELCEGSLVVHVLEWRGIYGIDGGVQMRRVRNFPTRSALIETLLASSHIPFLLDGRPWTTLTTTEGDLPHGTFKAIDSCVLHLLNMNVTEEAQVKYRVSTHSRRVPDITLFFKLDESLKDGPGVMEILTYEQGMELESKGYEHTMARLRTEEFSYLVTKKKRYDDK